MEQDSSPNQQADKAALRLQQLIQDSGLQPLSANSLQGFENYLALLLRWNLRVNLTAIRDVEGILSRHFVESIACSQSLPKGIKTLLDFGSGAGFPGIPIALCRPEIEITLAESQGKKAAFLREAVRTLGTSSRVYSGRAQTLGRHFDCVTLRAVDQMEAAVQAAAELVRPGGWLVPMTTVAEIGKIQSAAGADFLWAEPVAHAKGTERLVVLGLKKEDRKH